MLLSSREESGYAQLPSAASKGEARVLYPLEPIVRVLSLSHHLSEAGRVHRLVQALFLNTKLMCTLSPFGFSC